MQQGVALGSEVAFADQRVRRLEPLMTLAQDSRLALLIALGLSVLSFLWAVLATRKALSKTSAAPGASVSPERLAIMRLSDEIEPLTHGDLRANASDLDPDTGPIATSVNHVINEFRSVLTTLGTSSEELNRILDQSGRSTDEVAEACAEQSRLIHRSSNYLFSMSATMSGLSADSAECSAVAQTMVAKSKSGEHAVGAMLAKLSLISEEVSNTTQVMHRLAENLEAINESVRVVQDVAKQTDLLALNATIRASAGSRSSSATDAAADLGRLSDEVAQLAEVLGQATGEIGLLTGIIAKDASDTVLSMEHIGEEITAGVTQTEQADIALSDIRQSADLLYTRIQQMTERSVEQAGIVKQLTENMDAINQVTDQTVNGLTANVTTLAGLQRLASDLQHETSEYQLPNRRSRNPDQKSQRSSIARRAADRAVNV